MNTASITVNITVVKKLFTMAHNGSSKELCKALYKICAAMCCIVFESDLLDELTDDDLEGISVACLESYSEAKVGNRDACFELVNQVGASYERTIPQSCCFMPLRLT